MLRAIRELNRKLNERFFPRNVPRYVDRFRELTQTLAAEGGLVLHLGSGSVDLEPILNGAWPGTRLLALDLSLQALQENPGSLKVCGDAGALPLASHSANLIVAEQVFEHFAQPQSCLHECYRVLKEGGRVVVSGPNGRSYVALLARLTPLAFHRLVHRLEGGSRNEETEAFPTYYRFSSPQVMRRLARQAGFATVSIERFTGEPCYTTFLPVIHLMFIGYHLVMQKLMRFFGCHMTAVAVFEKPSRAVQRDQVTALSGMDFCQSASETIQNPEA